MKRRYSNLLASVLIIFTTISSHASVEFPAKTDVPLNKDLIGLNEDLAMNFNAIKGSQKVVTFPDTNLEKLIREEIKKPKGDIYKSDIEGIKSLIAVDSGITNIDGIENVTNLTDLNLAHNNISDITAISSLTNLASLDIQIKILNYHKN